MGRADVLRSVHSCLDCDAMNHCTHIPHRQSPDRAWPLRRADGTRFCEPRRDDEPRLPLVMERGK